MQIKGTRYKTIGQGEACGEREITWPASLEQLLRSTYQLLPCGDANFQ